MRKAGNHAAASGLRQGELFETFTAAQAADVEAFAAQIIPGDAQSPGAREAHVIHFLDHILTHVAPETRPQFLSLLESFQRQVAAEHPDGKSFADLNADQQIALIKSLEKSKSEFFEAMRVGTINGMFANPEYGGNFNKSGWSLIGFVDRFSWTAPFGYYDRPENIVG